MTVYGGLKDTDDHGEVDYNAAHREAGPKTSVGPRQSCNLKHNTFRWHRNVLCLRLQEESAKKTESKGKRHNVKKIGSRMINKKEKN